MREEEVASVVAKPPLAALGSLSPSPLSCVPSLASGSHSVSAATRHCPGELYPTSYFAVASSAGEGCHTAPHLLQTLLSYLAQAIADYVVFQVESRAHCIQIFDSWVDNYHLICGNTGQSLISKSSIWDPCHSKPKYGRRRLGSGIGVQGNVDPAYLFSPLPALTEEIQRSSLTVKIKIRFKILSSSLCGAVAIEAKRVHSS
ncbi:Uroporphyrinogen decarboxylase 1 [Arachis hypogaea]|uniref:Uroporphyrinogen decarboxylase 1 n=1 Tax=Arachis hypogaea TaxID=3818 RepID=A0A6B9VBE6_ARAHY|nr:Uroporphyrinogen decarboxylase 1 [Arachis hypogaea]